jgi:hypothetical protein
MRYRAGDQTCILIRPFCPLHWFLPYPLRHAYVCLHAGGGRVQCRFRYRPTLPLPCASSFALNAYTT